MVSEEESFSSTRRQVGVRRLDNSADDMSGLLADDGTEAVWQGPFAWNGYDHVNGRPSLPKLCGVYLFAVCHRNGYAIQGAGETTDTVARFKQHKRAFLCGEYTVLDIDELGRGIRKEVWHGWGWTQQKRLEYARRKPEIDEAVQKQLAGLKIFVADIGPEKRMRQRLEAKVMDMLYEQPPPLCDLPDRGVFLARRRSTEKPITVTSISTASLYGIPEKFEI